MLSHLRIIQGRFCLAATVAEIIHYRLVNLSNVHPNTFSDQLYDAWSTRIIFSSLASILVRT